MLLQLIQVTKQYGRVGQADGPVVLRDLSLEVADGQSLAIVGPSGCGKSTLLNIMGTLDRPTSGQVLLEGRDLSTLNDGQLATVRNQQIGWIFQLHHLLPQLTVLENVLVPTLAGNHKQSAGTSAPGRAAELLKRVGLADRLDHRPGQLSGGERQRVAVVRALINQPRLLLADEPTGALDRHAAETLADLLAELNRDQGVALVVVTHSKELAQRMGRVLELRDGRLEGQGPRA